MAWSTDGFDGHRGYAEPIMIPPIRPTLDKEVTKPDGIKEIIKRAEDSVFKMEVDDYIADSKVY